MIVAGDLLTADTQTALSISRLAPWFKDFIGGSFDHHKHD